MKNRKLLYLLVPLTIILWGLIIFRVFRHLNPPAPAKSFNTDMDSLSAVNHSEDTLILMANYSDPFLERNLVSAWGSSYESNNKVSGKTGNSTIPVIWPEVSYGGTIINKESNTIVYLIKINGANHLIKAGTSINRIKLIKTFNDSIIIQTGPNRKTIMKEKI
jgi:hypothetical protein